MEAVHARNPSRHGVFSLLAATELTDGVWYPKGGFQTVRNALLKICEEDGVDVRFESEVAEITTVRDDVQDGASSAG